MSASPIIREEIIGDCRLLLGDCLEIMPSLGEFDAVVTDPPYGIGITSSNRLAVSRGMGGKSWDDVPAGPEALSAMISKASQQIIWGGNYFDLPPTRCPLVWDKNNAGRDFADFELAWTNLDMVARRIVFRPMNMDGGKLHPTQKPVEVMRWCLGFVPEARAILDEIDPGYFEIACKRIREAYAQPDMFVAPPEPKSVQQAMFDEAAE
ncbi:MAG: hypothetical protein AB7L41_15520 [Flavobacteriaceae bacterium]